MSFSVIFERILRFMFTDYILPHCYWFCATFCIFVPTLLGAGGGDGGRGGGGGGWKRFNVELVIECSWSEYFGYVSKFARATVHCY